MKPTHRRSEYKVEISVMVKDTQHSQTTDTDDADDDDDDDDDTGRLRCWMLRQEKLALDTLR